MTVRAGDSFAILKRIKSNSIWFKYISLMFSRWTFGYRILLYLWGQNLLTELMFSQ